MKHMKSVSKSVLSKAKMKVNSLATCAASSASAALAAVGLGFCDGPNANTAMQNFLKTMFNILMFGGIIMAAVGAVMLIRTIIALASGDQAQPGAIGKGVGFLVGGLVLIGAKLFVTSILGNQDPTTMTFI